MGVEVRCEILNNLINCKVYVKITLFKKNQDTSLNHIGVVGEKQFPPTPKTIMEAIVHCAHMEPNCAGYTGKCAAPPTLLMFMNVGWINPTHREYSRPTTALVLFPLLLHTG